MSDFVEIFLKAKFFVTKYMHVLNLDHKAKLPYKVAITTCINIISGTAECYFPCKDLWRNVYNFICGPNIVTVQSIIEHYFLDLMSNIINRISQITHIYTYFSQSTANFSECCVKDATRIMPLSGS